MNRIIATVVLSLLIVGMIIGCSNSRGNISNDLRKDSQKIYDILVDHMTNGTPLDKSKQSQIDYYEYNIEDKFEKSAKENKLYYSEEEEKLISGIFRMNEYAHDYEFMDNKKQIMNKFMEESEIVKELLK